jgi:hypothetical protein
MFLAGNDYTEYLMSKFKYKTDVLEGMRIGERMAYLDKFYIVTNNDNYATKHNFALIDPEAVILEEIIKQEFAVINNEGLLEEYAEIGPRGGVKESKKAPKSDTPNPNPKGKDSAKGDASTTRGAEVDATTEKTLQDKADDFNERYKDKLGYGVNVGMLKSVYQRGLGAYNTSHSPNVTSAKQWALARVNAFLYLVKEGRPENKKYDSDFDLLPTKHPKREDFEINVAGLPNFINEASSGKKHNFASELAEKQMLIGPLMTPNKLIPRVDEVTGEEYQVFFSKETIEKIAYKMMADKLVDSVNIEHDGAIKVDDAHLVETWIVKDVEHDKSTLYGFLPVVGQWFGIYRIGDGRVWNEYVKTGKVKGFSVEGYFYNNVLTKK